MDTTLLKGLNVLEALATSHSPRGVSDLARALGLTKSNVHRTLQTLVAAGYAKPAALPGHYECTLKLFEIASAIIARVDVRQAADPFMQQLAKLTKETIHLSVLDGIEVIYLNKIESPHPVRAYSVIGGRAPAHCVASGKALLAWQGDAVLQQLPGHLPAHTPQSIDSRDAVIEELSRIRRTGFAVNRGEWRESVGGVAAVVFDAARKPVAAIGISGPVERLRPATTRKYGQLVTEAALGLSRALGYTDTHYPPALASAV